MNADGEGHRERTPLMTEAKNGVTQLQAKEHQGFPYVAEARRRKEGFFPRVSGRPWPFQNLVFRLVASRT